MNAIMDKANLSICLCMLSASIANAAGERTDPDRMQRPDGVSCVERASDADSALWRAYRSCVVQADKLRISDDRQRAFVDGCLAGSRTHEVARVADSSAVVHRRETW